MAAEAPKQMTMPTLAEIEKIIELATSTADLSGEPPPAALFTAIYDVLLAYARPRA